MRKLNENDFIKQGYKKYEGKNVLHPHAYFLLQKRIEDEKKRTKYFIDIWFYDDNFEVELYVEKKHYTSQILIYAIDDEYFDIVEMIEKEVEKIWEALGSPYYRG